MDKRLNFRLTLGLRRLGSHTLECGGSFYETAKRIEALVILRGGELGEVQQTSTKMG